VLTVYSQGITSQQVIDTVQRAGFTIEAVDQ